MFWESDWGYLNRLWQEWGITFFYDGPTLVLCDSTGAYRKHGPAYETLRYQDRDGQRIDEEHVYQFGIARALTTGKVSVTDYDYTQSRANLATKDSDYRERANDNIEHYAWGDYAQPLAGAMGTAAQPNEVDFEGEHLARVRLEAKRAKSLRGKGRGNVRGLRVGHTFHLEGYPLAPGNGEYLVVATKIEIVNNDTVTNRGALQRQYTCDTQFTVQPANTYFRTPQKARKPRSHGEVAIVTGCSDSKIWTDRYGRAKVWFPWDREGKQDQDSSCWVRVSSPWQGANYGAIYIPRVGHEVVIGYQDNDPDKPYIVGRHVNQFHEPPWPLPANQALSGWMSEDLEGPTTNSVVTDDTPGKLQVQVASDHAQSRLVLGSNTRIDRRKGRSEARGEGFDLATEAHGVARANRGMLVTTEARAGAGAPVKDMVETVQRLTQARALHEDMAQFARRHKAQDAQVSQGDATAGMKAQNEAIKGGAKSTTNPSPEMTRPDLVLASAAGIAATASDSMHLASQNDHAITAGRDVSMASGRSWLASVRGVLSFISAKGMKLFAARGKVEIQAQGDAMALAALKDLTISSTDGRIVIDSAKEVWIGAGGSYIQINGSGIINVSPGTILEKCAKWSKTGPDSKLMPLEALKPDYQAQYILTNAKSGLPMVRYPYQLKLPDGRTLSGITTDQGETIPVFTAASQPVQLHLAEAGKPPPNEAWHLIGGGGSIFSDHKDS